ncbi:class I adenylate-forming enzyme family protein [Streptomyces sp. H51]|uniref:class I adenylate-forming enzyme family protein n=1 Tax=Streptomyces sp. H51 TaxID=3111770 RepID=UPI002D776B2E|nr:class I adenylate-forming enzyme family protein [Streptomyces sp. H51]
MIAHGANRIEQLVLASAARHTERAALATPTQQVTYGRLAAAAERGGVLLTAAGCRPGEAVLLTAGNRPEDIIWELAIWLAAGVVVPVSPTTPLEVVRRIARRTGARFLAGADTPESWQELFGNGPSGEGLRTLAGTAGSRPAELDADQALVIFTSGSTGEPKGVVLSHRVLVGKLRAIQQVLPFAPDTVTLQVLQLHFSFGQWTSLLTLATGGLLQLRPAFSATRFLHDLTSLRIDRTAVVPSMLRIILRTLDGAEDGEDLLRRIAARCSPRLWIAGGEPLPGPLGRQVRARFPRSSIADVFGLSESATSDLILTPDRYDQEAGTLGRPTPGVRIRVVDAAGADCGPGDAGELWIRTEHLMTGYLDDPAATAATLTEGWLRTGDRARRRPDGLLELAGRAKDLIVRGGSKISPLEVENVFSAHPDCAGCVAVGVPDDLLGERLHLLLMPRPGRAVDPVRLLDWSRERLERHKTPDRVHVVDDLPLGRTGKVDRGLARTVALSAPAAREGDKGCGNG